MSSCFWLPYFKNYAADSLDVLFIFWFALGGPEGRRPSWEGLNVPEDAIEIIKCPVERR